MGIFVFSATSISLSCLDENKKKEILQKRWVLYKKVFLKIDACQKSVYHSLKKFTLEHMVLRGFNLYLPYGDPRKKIKCYYSTYTFWKCGTRRGKAFPVFNEAANREKLCVRDVNLHTFLTSR